MRSRAGRLRNGSRLVTSERSDADARVLVVTAGWPRDDDPAYGIFIRRQVESLAQRGIGFEVIFIRGYLTAWAYAVAGMRFVLLNFRRSRYALVHAHGGEASLVARLYLRAPVLASYCGDDLLGAPRADASFPIGSRLRRRLQRLHSLSMTATVTKSKEMEKTLPRRAQRRNTVIPNGVDTHLFTPASRERARAALGWPDEERTVLFVGDPVIPRKRYSLAVAACAEAAARLPSLGLRVVSGVDPELLPLYMNAADCLLLTSVLEGSPNVVKEALMCNLPVVSTRVGDVEEVLRGVEPSFVCESNPRLLADGLIACLRRPTRSNGRSRSDWLSDSAIADRVIRIYEHLERAGPRRMAQAAEGSPPLRSDATGD